jgi:hypothetical protein
MLFVYVDACMGSIVLLSLLVLLSWPAAKSCRWKTEMVE